MTEEKREGTELASLAARDEEDLEKVKDALDRSSGLNRNLLLTFFPAMFYILIVAASTTDRQLLVPDSVIKLPILGVEINLFYFFAVAPALVVVFHFDLLFNLVNHSRKLHAWATQRTEAPTLFPFLFNNLVDYRERSASRYLLKITLWSAYFFLPYFTLLFILWRFAAYHSLPMSAWHLISLCLDAVLLFFYWPRADREPLLGKEHDRFWRMFTWHLKKGYFIRLGQLVVFLILWLVFIVKKLASMMRKWTGAGPEEAPASEGIRPAGKLEAMFFWTILLTGLGYFCLLGLLFLEKVPR